jgi:hypothetical protein
MLCSVSVQLAKQRMNSHNTQCKGCRFTSGPPPEVVRSLMDPPKKKAPYPLRGSGAFMTSNIWFEHPQHVNPKYMP